jgi:hypothetical protein
MNTAYTIAIITILGSGVSAGAVTFWMNFWKAQWDFRRAKIEELYAAVHKYTTEMPLMSARVRTGTANLDNTSREFATEEYHRISLLIDLYFPRLRPTFYELVFALGQIFAEDGALKTDEKGLEEEVLHAVHIGAELKLEVIELSRQGSLRALIEAVQNYDQDHS